MINLKKDDIISEYGPWTSHNIKLGDGIYTVNENLNYDTLKLRRVMQIIKDISSEEMGSLRVLDLGSNEGLYTIELGLQGVKSAVGVEGREANLKKAEFVKDVLKLNNIQFFQDDVRNLSQQKYGRFDVVLCLGLLYHLDACDTLRLIEKIYAMCEKALIIDTNISLENTDKITYGEEVYFGHYEREFAKGLSREEKEKKAWNALDNEKSFLFSKKSLLRILHDAGFASVYECHVPFEYIKPDGRITFLAVKRGNVKIRTYPSLNDLAESEIKNNMAHLGYKKISLVLIAKKIYRIVKKIFKMITNGYYKER